jgi:hypothetical protein
MINKIVCNAEDLTAIADAVRASNGSTNTYNVPELSAAAVNAIGAGGSGVNIDDTLTIAGAAADAKVTGDKFKALTEEIAKLPTGGGNADWNASEGEDGYVKNRTHWLERGPYDPILWDGSTEGRDSVDLSAVNGQPAGSIIAYKISDHVLTKDEISSSTVYASSEGETVQGKLNAVADFVPDAIWTTGYSLQHLNNNVVSEFAVGTIICTAISGDYTGTMGVVIPSVGTYAMQNTNVGVGKHLVEINADTYHTIDERHLPDNVAKLADVEKSEKRARDYSDDAIDVLRGNVSRAYIKNDVMFSMLNGVIPSYAFAQGNYGIENLVMPQSIREVKKDAFIRCVGLRTVTIIHYVDCGSCIFANCPDLREVHIDESSFVVQPMMFMGCNELSEITLGDCFLVTSECFAECAKLNVVRIKKTTGVINNTSSNIFRGTPIESGTGYIYVPRALLNDYKAEESWSTYASQFRALEDYTVDGTITGDLDESKI